MPSNSRRLDSVCVYCASSNAADPDFLAAASQLGRTIADEGLRLVYGGGGVGLMGAAAKAAHTAGGRVLGVIPQFLTSHERPLRIVETVVVTSMHERKMMMFDEADAFAILPGGIGTLEEVVELLSWRRLGLHSKPIVFLNLKGFWDPLFGVFDHILAQQLVPPEFSEVWRAVTRVEDILPTLRSMPTVAFASPPGVEELT
ncbi:MAG TPA: TIGR00730 family Rossman fold protein, partial [Caulobacteraceae bacterium]|nr:TIGR00730 family Rossman fold protein [Caulobacteraceae bacterium]